MAVWAENSSEMVEYYVSQLGIDNLDDMFLMQKIQVRAGLWGTGDLLQGFKGPRGGGLQGACV